MSTDLADLADSFDQFGNRAGDDVGLLAHTVADLLREVERTHPRVVVRDAADPDPWVICGKCRTARDGLFVSDNYPCETVTAVFTTAQRLLVALSDDEN